ncbi:CocE/NonD family hydrolase [Microbacterium sp. 18062]|uniref:CocE/NonD family hydrolase n=1 Tax=Microbacterium sp. 18062 TaxID=2681410 RepID=UPI00135CA40B|nr:CocE/NonD family hydrolase [Microbacterium sp. 18062]
MRDGVTLGADVYSPADASRGVLLTWGPYGRGAYIARSAATVWAAQGYTVVLASSRGTADSGGDLDPQRTEVEDGHDIVAWMRQQSWYAGRFATVGGSYLAHTQWALLDDPEPDHVAAVTMVGPHDFARHAWGTGTFRLDFFGWAEQIVLQKSGSTLKALVGIVTSTRRLRPILRSAPLVDAAEAHFGDRAPWFRERLTRDDIDTDYWTPMRHGGSLERATLPILIQGGWQDIFLPQTIEQYRTLRARGVEVALTVGPWVHIALRSGAGAVMMPETLDWLDTHLAGITDSTRPERVRAYDKGAERWVGLDDWRTGTDLAVLRLGADGGLSPATDAAEGERSFVFDPEDPTPTVGGNLIAGGGYVDDRKLGAREDVLVYTSEPFPASRTIAGAPVVELAHRTQHPDADLFVRVGDVDPKGRSTNITDGYVRLVGPHDRAALALFETLYTIKAGHRLRLTVAGGSFPQFARNSGTGQNPATAATMVTNTHTISHGGASVLRVPFLDTNGS